MLNSVTEYRGKLLLFKAHFKTMKDVEAFIDKLQYFGHTKTHFVFLK